MEVKKRKSVIYFRVTCIMKVIQKSETLMIVIKMIVSKKRVTGTKVTHLNVTRMRVNR